MSPPVLENKITVGNIWQMAVAIAAVAVAWGVFNSSLTTHAKSIDDHEVRLRALERETLDRLTRMEAILGRIDRKVGQ